MELPTLSRTLIVRIVLISFTLALALGLHINRQRDSAARGGRMPYHAWQQASRSQLLLHDFTMRLSFFADLVRTRKHVPLPGPFSPEALRDRALAGYETIVLDTQVPVPNPYAAYRLGIFYGLDGYDEQAEELLLGAIRCDPDNERTYTALLRLFAPDAAVGGAPDHLGGMLPELGRLPRWLQDVVLPRYYHLARTERGAAGQAGSRSAHSPDGARDRGVSRRYAPSHRVGAPHPYDEAAAAARRQAQAHQWQFGMGVMALGVVVSALLLTGLWVVLRWLHASIFSEPLPPEKRKPRAPAFVPWGIIDAAELLALAFGAMVVLGVVMMHLKARIGGAAADPDLAAGLVGSQYLLLISICFFVMLRRVRASAGRELTVLGWRCPNGVRQALAWGVGGYGVYLVVLVAATRLPGVFPGFDQALAQVGINLPGDATVFSTVTYIILLGLIAPVAEELLFRGFLYPALRNRLPVISAVLLSALAFGLLHLNTPARWQILVFGVVLAVLYERTRSVIPCVICHALNNLLVFAALMLVHS